MPNIENENLQEIRKNPLCVISIEAYGDYQVHDIQTNSGWIDNPYGEEYVIVPDEMVLDIMKTKGFCDIIITRDKTKLISFKPREIPYIPEPEQPVTELERLRADIDYLALLKGVEL